MVTTHGGKGVEVSSVAGSLKGRAGRRANWRRSIWFTLALGLAACGLRSAVTLTMQPARGTPPDASVIIDEQFVGFLGYVAARGIRLPEGEHRITVEREGYFPWDRIVESDRKPIALEVELIPIPD